MPFRANFEKAMVDQWSDHYIRFKKLRNTMRSVRASSPPLPPSALSAKAAKFARKLDREIESVDLFASATAGAIAESMSVAAAEAFELAGLFTDKRVRALAASASRPAALRAVRELHDTYCRIAEEVASLISFLDWNVRAVDRLLKLAARTFDSHFNYSGGRRFGPALAAVEADAEAVAAVLAPPSAAEASSLTLLSSSSSPPPLPPPPPSSSSSSSRAGVAAAAVAVALREDRDGSGGAAAGAAVENPRNSLSGLDALMSPSPPSDPEEDDFDVEPGVVRADVVARRSERSAQISLHAARLHLTALSQNHHARTIAGFIATLARALDRLAVAEEALMEKAAAEAEAEAGEEGEEDVRVAVAGAIAAGAASAAVDRGERVLSDVVVVSEGGGGGGYAGSDARGGGYVRAGQLLEGNCRMRGEQLIRRLISSKNLMESRGVSTTRTLAAQAGIDADALEEAVEDERGEQGLAAEERRRQALPQLNLVLNVLSAFLYMVSMYAPLPTAPKYAESLGARPALSGILIGGAPMAGIISAFMFSALSTRAFKGSLLLASGVCMVGNFMYAFAATPASVGLALAGRFIIGFGGARAINRRYIADCAPLSQLVRRSAEFVTASAVGMAAGPALAAVVNRLPPFSFAGLHFDSRTNAAWALAVIWAVYIAVLLYGFVEPTRPPSPSALTNGVESGPGQFSPVAGGSESDTRPLLGNGSGAERYGAVPQSSRSSQSQRVSPLREVFQNKPVVFCLILYFVIKLVCELLLSSTALSLPYLYGWGDSRVGIFVAFLGGLMFPANVLVARLMWKYEEKEQLFFSLCAVLVGCIIAMPILGFMPLAQYITACVVIFVSTNAAEACVMAILAQIVPSSIARGTFNSGLLSTEAGMMGRAAGDIGVYFAAAGPEGVRYMLLREFGPCACLVFLCLVGMQRLLLSLPDDADQGSDLCRSSLDEKEFDDEEYR